MTLPRIILRTMPTAAIFAAVGFSIAARSVVAADLDQRRSALAGDYAKQLADLARACEAGGADALATEIARWRPPSAAAQLVIFLPDQEPFSGCAAAAPDSPTAPGSPAARDSSAAPDSAANAATPDSPTAPGSLAAPASPQDDSPWRRRFLALRRAYAEQLWELARQAAAVGRGSLAIQLANEVLREQPDQDAARRVLGYAKYDGRWTTATAREQLQRGLVWHHRFGWLRAEDVGAYEQGKRRAGDTWIDTAEDARRHRAMRNGWQIETDHYLVTTNHSLEAGVELAGRLERLYAVWSQVFADYYLDSRQLANRFARGAEARAAGNAVNDSSSARNSRNSGRSRSRETSGSTVNGPNSHEFGYQNPSRRSPAGRRFRVDYFRTRAEYTAALRPRQPLIGKTLGIYFGTARRGYFFAGSDQDRGTLWHEATHQLFHETRPVAQGVGRRNNFWVVEGIAAYMESLAEHHGYCTLGGIAAGRLPAARQRLLQDGFYVPLAQLVRMDIDSIQRHDQINKLYSQMAGTATFLMHDDGGRYRPALMRYLRAVYNGRAQTRTLAKQTGVGYDELDRQYREFLEAGGERMTND